MGSEMPGLVSVIVPFLNGSDWLIEALESVLQQTYHNWELIVMDDGSEQLQSLAAKNFCDKHPDKILYTEHTNHVNKGVTISRNEAAKLARGEYLAFLDADDIWKPGKLARQIQQFEKNPFAQAICDASVHWYSWKNASAEDVLELIGAPAGKCYPPRSLTKIQYPFYVSNSPAPSGIIITKKAFIKIGGFEAAFSGIYELYEDQAFLAKLYLNETVFISDAADVLYRKRDNSMSSAINDAERYNTVRLFYFDWLENYMRRHHIIDDEVDCLIHKARKESMLALAAATVA